MPDAEGEALIQKMAGEAPRLHSIGKYQVGFKDQRGFAPIEKLWGVGLSLVGPMDSKTGVRSNIGVYDMELEDVHFEHDTLKKETGTYYQKRKEWLAKQEGAKWKRPLPYEVIHNDGNRVDGYRIGFEYEMGGVSQVQMSYFLMCGKRMFHLKSLYASEKASTDGVALAKAAETFHCNADVDKVGLYDRKEISEFWKKAKSTPGGRAQALEALREFFLQYEIEHQNVDQDDSEFEARLDRVRSLIEGAFGIQSAFAEGPGDSCFFAGWKSSWTTTSKGKRICAEPAGLKNCGEGQLACNPGVFGNVCISDDFRQQATQVCHAEYLREASKHDQEITKIQESDPGVFQEVQEAADSLCSSEPYASANFSLCTSLYNRIQKINPESGAGSPEREPPGIDPSNYQEAYDTTQELLQLVENHCMTEDKKGMVATVVVQAQGQAQTIDCVKARDTALKNLKQLDAVKSNTNFKAIEDRACEVLPPGFKAIKDTAKVMEDKVEPSCTDAEKAKRGNCGKDILCAVAANAATMVTLGFPIKVGGCDTHRDSCLANAATAVVKSLWESVKGLVSLAGKAISGLASDAYRGAKNLGKGLLNFFGASYEIDDASSYKTVQFAKSAGGLIGDFIKAPGESIKKFMNGIWSGINEWMMRDAFCQEWSGVAHMSTCLKPSSGWSCLSCKEAINGSCAVMGYLATEIAAAFFTGGVASAIKMTGVGAKVASILGKLSKAGKMTKFGLASKFPKLAKTANLTGKALGKASKVVKITAKVTGKVAGKVGGFALKMLTGSAKAIIRTLEKIPLVNIPVKVVKLGAQQGAKFVKWYAELNRKAFAAGGSFFRGPTRAGTKFAKMEAEGAAVLGTERRLAQTAGESGGAKAASNAKTGSSARTAEGPRVSSQARKEARRNLNIIDQESANQMKNIQNEKEAFRSALERVRKRPTERNQRMAKDLEEKVILQEGKERVLTESFAERSVGRPLTEAEKEAVWQAHLVGEGKIGKDGTLAAKGNYTAAQIREKNRILEKAGFDAQTRENLMVDGVVGLESGGVDLMKIDQVPNSTKKMEEFLAGAEPEELRVQLQGMIDRRNELYTQKLSSTRLDPALDKELRELTNVLDQKGPIHYNSVLQKKLGKNSTEWSEMLKKKRLDTVETGGAPAAQPSAGQPSAGQPSAGQPSAYSKTVDESLEALNRYDRDFAGGKMGDEFTELSKRADSSEKKIELQKRIAEQESALKELEQMKKTHQGNFASSSMKGARDAEVRIDMRKRSLTENLEKLKAEEKSLEVSIRSAESKIEDLNSGDFRDYVLKNRLSGEQPFDARFNQKVRDQIEDLKRLQKNYKPEDLPALKKINVEGEIKRLEEFLKKSESFRDSTGPPGAAGSRGLDSSPLGEGLPKGSTRQVTLKNPTTNDLYDQYKHEYSEVIWKNLPDTDPKKKILRTLESKGVKVVEFKKAPGSRSKFDGLYLGKKSLVDGKGRKIGDFEVVAIHEDVFKRGDSFTKILAHEAGHWNTFGNPKNLGDFARGWSKKVTTELDLPESLVEYRKFAASDEARQYSKQGLMELRGVGEAEVQTLFGKDPELSMSQVFGEDYRKRLSTARYSFVRSTEFSEFEEKTFSALANQVKEKPFSPLEVIDQLDVDGHFKIPVKNKQDHWDKTVTLARDEFPGMPRDEVGLQALRDEKLRVIREERERFFRESGWSKNELKDPEVASYLDRQAQNAAIPILEKKHPWMKSFNQKLSKDFETAAKQYGRSKSEIKKGIKILEKLEYDSKISKKTYAELRASFNRGSTSLSSRNGSEMASDFSKMGDGAFQVTVENGRTLEAPRLSRAKDYRMYLERQNAGKADDLSQIARPGIAKVVNGEVMVVQGAGRWEKTAGTDYLDVFIPEDVPLPQGAVTLERGVSQEQVRTINLISSRGAKGSNPEVVEAITSAERYNRVLVPKSGVSAPGSIPGQRLQEVMKKALEGPNRTDFESLISSPQFKQLNSHEQLELLNRKLEGK